ncbi:MAG: two pore domain potassium channel family protein [Chloroflexi bacterium]|nr:two pore domain potassium channel family protein [Chloroflexota bacterium]
MFLPIVPLIYSFIRTIWSLLRDPETRGVIFLVIIVLISGMVFYHAVEGWTWLDSLYFSVITLTTVGYGDLTPKTDAGKMFTMIYIFIGLGILAGFITLLAQRQQERGRQLRERRRNRRGNAAGQETASQDAEQTTENDSEG